MRTLIEQDPFRKSQAGQPWTGDGQWPAAWISLREEAAAPFVCAYRLRFDLGEAVSIRVHVSADERYQLFYDGERIGRGSERGSPESWFYETYDLMVAPGTHCLVAQVWSFGALAPIAQMHYQDGFLLCAEGKVNALLSTGVAPWEAKILSGYQFFNPPTFATGPTLSITGKEFSWGFEAGLGQGWKPARSLEPAYSCISPYDKHETRFMKPAMLPAMIEKPITTATLRASAWVETLETQNIPVQDGDLLNCKLGWEALFNRNEPLMIDPHTRLRVIVDLEDYYCAYSQVVTSRGEASLVRISWTEALFTKPGFYQPKGNRDQIDGKYFFGLSDTFFPDGADRRSFEILWWKAGRYLEIVVRTEDQPLVLERINLIETRYPLEMESRIATSDPRLEEVIPILVRGIQMDAHETYMDCPFYEQLMYAGDTRLEILATYMMTRDDRLPKKAIRMFDLSRRPSGISLSRYPTSQFQVVPPFTLWWVAMVRDYALWRGDMNFLRRTLPGVHAAIEGYDQNVNENGLLQSPEGWNFMDWTLSWSLGTPPDADLGVSGLLNWQYVLVLKMTAELESMLEKPELAALTQRRAEEIASRASEAFWDDQAGLFADDLSHRNFSEHTQCLALLTRTIDPARKERIAEGLTTRPDLVRTTVYFTHYLFEAYREIGRVDALLNRMELWFSLVKEGFKTPIEQPEPSRSDCHAWGSHPLYHYFATILGIRPASLGFRTVSIAPQLGPLRYARGELVHPAGLIRVEFQQDGQDLHGEISLPEGVMGAFEYQGRVIPLHSGSQKV